MSWICPDCERELRNENQWHNCIKTTVDELFEKKPADLVLTFDSILMEVADWDDVVISTTKNCIVFVHKLTFLIIRPMQKQIDIKFYSSQQLDENLAAKSTYAYGGKYENHTRISRPEEVTPLLLQLLRGSYELL